MNIAIENLSGCKKLVRVEVSPEEFQRAMDDVLTSVQKSVALPGFRPGKTPKQLLLKRFEKDILQEAKEKLMEDSLRRAVQEHKLNVVGRPEFEEVQYGAGLPYMFVIRVETAPEFELPEYKGIPVKRELRTVTDADVDRALDVLREKQVTYLTVARPARKGDVLVVNFRGSVDSKPISELVPSAKGLSEQTGFWVGTDPETFLPGFGEQLLGAQAGEKRTVTVLFPAGFRPAELAGLQAIYEVEVVEVKEKVMPELTDEFAKQWGAESVQALREGVRRDLERELEYSQKRKIQSQIIQVLLSRAQFELPESLVAAETRDIVYDIVAENARKGVPREVIEKSKDEIFRTAVVSARDRVKLNFLLFKIADKEGISVTPEEILRRVQAMSAIYQIPVEKLIKDLSKRGGIDELRERILLEKTLDFLEANAQIEDVPAVSAPV